MQSYKRNAWDKSLETLGGWGVGVLESRSIWAMDGFGVNLYSATNRLYMITLSGETTSSITYKTLHKLSLKCIPILQFHFSAISSVRH